MGNAGRVLMIPKGDYNPATPYEMLDCVYYNGRSYVCKQASTGHAPTDIMYWQPMTPDSSAEIQALTNQVYENWCVGKNLIPNKATSQTISGVTFTVNSDGTVTANGTSTAVITFNYSGTDRDIPLNGDFKVSGCPAGGSSSTYYLRVNPSNANNVDEYGDGKQFSLTSALVRIDIIIQNGQTVDNLVFKPMVTDADIPNSDYAHYQPYAKTNVELTQDASWLTGAKTYYDANTDPTVKQNHYNVAKYFYDFIKAGESHTVIVRYAGGYFDTMIISKDSGNGLYCVDFCHADGLGKILYFRYNGTSDTFTDLFSVT